MRDSELALNCSKTKENLRATFIALSYLLNTGALMALGAKTSQCSSEVRNHPKKNFGGDLQPFAIYVCVLLPLM